jgi:transcription termination/antitermination protein NusA
VYRETQVDDDDVNLDEFADEIEGWIIDSLKGIGCDTAKNVLNIPRNELIKRTDLEEETIDEVLKVLKSEFD